MSKIEWSDGNLPTLTKLYLMRVRKNMRTGSSVRFGLMGNGTSPNYEIALPDGRSLAYSGLSHKRHSQADTFDEKNTSQLFTEEQIEEAIAKAPSAADR